MANDVLLQMTDICKQFPGVKALDGVSLTVRARHGPRADGRKRRRQIHADEVPVRHL